MKKRKRMIGIVGAAISNEELAKIQSAYATRGMPRLELWGVNNIHKAFPDVTFHKWFEIHAIKMVRGTFTRRDYAHYPPNSETTTHDYLKGLDELNIPVYMQRKWTRVKQSRVFPHDRIVEEFGHYFGCSFAWMIAFALQEKVDGIHFFGCHLTGNEYFYQRPSTERMIGIAEGRGVYIDIHESSQLLASNYEYAYGEDFDRIYLLHGRFASDITHTLISAISERIQHHNGTESLPWEAVNRQRGPSK